MCQAWSLTPSALQQREHNMLPEAAGDALARMHGGDGIWVLWTPG